MFWKSDGGIFTFIKREKVIYRGMWKEKWRQNAFAIKVLWRARNVKEEKLFSTDCFFNLRKEKCWRSFTRIAGSRKGKFASKLKVIGRCVRREEIHQFLFNFSRPRKMWENLTEREEENSLHKIFPTFVCPAARPSRWTAIGFNLVDEHLVNFTTRNYFYM